MNEINLAPEFKNVTLRFSGELSSDALTFAWVDGVLCMKQGNDERTFFGITKKLTNGDY